MLTLRPEATSVRQARVFVSSWARTWGHHQLITSAALLTSELATNAVKHARDVFHVDVVETDHGIQVGVTDSSADLPVVRPTQEVQSEGRGMLLVDAIASSWGVEPRAIGKRVWFELRQSHGRT